MRKARKRSKKPKIVFLSLVLVAGVFLGIGYAALSQRLDLEGTANLYASYKYLWFELTNEERPATYENFQQNPYEPGKYSFVGQSDQNYISLNNELWRIVSIESDHTIKVVRIADAISTPFDESENRDSQTSTYCNYTTQGCNSWSSRDLFTNGDFSGNVASDSTMLTLLNTTVYNEFSEEFKNQIVDHDFYVGPVALNSTIDQVITAEKEYVWSGKVGLLSISEMMIPHNGSDMILGGTSQTLFYVNNYLLAETGWFWTITPYTNTSHQGIIAMNASNNSATSGISVIAFPCVINTGKAMPVVHLKSTTEYVSGTGTPEDPFIVK